MENYILSLIKENNRVIVPNFGAFIVAKENGFSVLFNNFLSFNDGLLVDHIVSEESITRDEAEKKVAKYVEEVKQHLDEKGTYIINDLGTFTKDATGILRFEQSDTLSESSASEVQAKEEVKDDLLDIDNTTAVEPEVNQDLVETPLVNTYVNDATPIAEFEEEKPEETEPEVTTSRAFEPELKEEKVEKDPIEVANKYLEEDNTKRNRSIVFFLSIFILLPLIGFSIYFFLLKDNSPAVTQQKINNEIKKTEPKQVEIKPAAGSIEAGPDKTSEDIKKEEPVEPPKPAVESEVYKPHQLIVGSFSTELNAEKMVKKLNEKGYDKCFCFEHNNRFLVSLESFKKVYEAQARQEEILNNERMESWIITKRK